MTKNIKNHKTNISTINNKSKNHKKNKYKNNKTL